CFLLRVATTGFVTLHLHGALPILARAKVVEAQLREAEARLARAEVRAPADGVVLARAVEVGQTATQGVVLFRIARDGKVELRGEDRKSTRLNSSHVKISYAVFCLK